MSVFEMIKYHGRVYPPDIPLRTEEIAAHLDVKGIEPEMEYSLHTEYSYGKRKFNSVLLENYKEITMAEKGGIPQLWKNELWANQFAKYIIDLVGDKSAPRVIEIHPPFNDYSDLESFAEIYSVFENEIKSVFPQTEILIENRCGSTYHGGKFILSKTQDAEKLAEIAESKKLSLKMAYDVPQIYTAHNAKETEQFVELLNRAKEFRAFIGGVHLWGKQKSDSGRKVSHCGDLTSYFGDESTKDAFLHAFKDCFDDNIVRKMVLEVNSGNEDLTSIVRDLLSVGVDFV